jgi:hypothetical protein
MKRYAFAICVGTVALSLLAPGLAPAAGEVVLNPFGNLTMQVLAEPAGATPGRARLTIVTANGAVTSDPSKTAYFGLRIMGQEDMQMTGFDLTGSGNCIVSDFAGTHTDGYQLGGVFGAGADPVGTPNAHMRMVGGFLRRACGNLVIDIEFTARPLVAFYGAFYGLNPAPWHQNYDEPPFDTFPTGGDERYQEWWNLWGSFDTLGYSNACQSVSGTMVSCG